MFVLIPGEEGGQLFYSGCPAHTLTVKMETAAGLLLLLICAGAVLYPAEAQDPYSQLPVGYKKGVDLSLEQLSSHSTVHHHFRFLRTVDKQEIEVKKVWIVHNMWHFSSILQAYVSRRFGALRSPAQNLKQTCFCFT